MTITDNGWDSRAWLEGSWVHREPRRPEVRPKLLAETQLLPWLAPQLPVPVPIPEPTEYGVRHQLLVGEPLTDGSTALGRQLGSFLKALHGVDPDEAVAYGAQDRETAAAERAEVMQQMRDEVLPLLPTDVRAAGTALLGRLGHVFTQLVHADLGPEHLRIRDGRVAGIIDWTDAHIGDPALDLSWLLHNSPAGIAAGVAETYEVSHELRERARDWHRLGPWYAVLYGLENDLPDEIEGGLAGVLVRL
ncbi:aminoglycoside phosphotransferase (APT) family kinase protein [Kribbella amoyensis]|uniref:Aminoglycoside phosphotransferase (APT) family kinase protein n=1 Tax=Kribbella amoyensis TaxID=996641 RepID=A0A561C006_9ACTN|nr:phosphotransferase [Kribbella amoyensis]TWD84454.1 aminoglycoside phosphotransferase (APT) family kinase protein [Kribbella amoyensis]